MPSHPSPRDCKGGGQGGPAHTVGGRPTGPAGCPSAEPAKGGSGGPAHTVGGRPTGLLVNPARIPKGDKGSGPRRGWAANWARWLPQRGSAQAKCSEGPAVPKQAPGGDVAAPRMQGERGGPAHTMGGQPPHEDGRLVNQPGPTTAWDPPTRAGHPKPCCKSFPGPPLGGRPPLFRTPRRFDLK